MDDYFSPIFEDQRRQSIAYWAGRERLSRRVSELGRSTQAPDAGVKISCGQYRNSGTTDRFFKVVEHVEHLLLLVGTEVGHGMLNPPAMCFGHDSK